MPNVIIRGKCAEEWWDEWLSGAILNLIITEILFYFFKRYWDPSEWRGEIKTNNILKLKHNSSNSILFNTYNKFYFNHLSLKSSYILFFLIKSAYIHSTSSKGFSHQKKSLISFYHYIKIIKSTKYCYFKFLVQPFYISKFSYFLPFNNFDKKKSHLISRFTI